jgi:hypothetical protein
MATMNMIVRARLADIRRSFLRIFKESLTG